MTWASLFLMLSEKPPFPFSWPHTLFVSCLAAFNAVSRLSAGASALALQLCAVGWEKRGVWKFIGFQMVSGCQIVPDGANKILVHLVHNKDCIQTTAKWCRLWSILASPMSKPKFLLQSWWSQDTSPLHGSRYTLYFMIPYDMYWYVIYIYI